jgi:hypothetical protein
VDYTKSWLLLADHAGGLLQVLQRLPGLSKVLQYSEISSIGYEPDHQAMTI